MTVYLLKTKQLQSCPEKKAPNLWQIYIVCRCSVGQRKIMLWLVSNSLLTSLFSYTTFHLIISPILQAFFFSLWSPTTLRKLSDCCSHCMLLPVPPAPGVHLWNQGTSSIWALCKSVAELSQFIGFRGLNVNLFKQSVAYKWYQIKKKKKRFLYIFKSVHTMHPTEHLQWFISFYIRMWFTWLTFRFWDVQKGERIKSEQSLRSVLVIGTEMAFPFILQ